MDEMAMRRVYGAEHDDPGPRSDRAYRELVGGPLDGLLLDVTGWSGAALDADVALETELGARPGGRSVYAPRPGDRRYWDWRADAP
ncbi:hypothetical protein OG440_40110 (plasmid) [Streptomyces sp. NBC_00637]|uniref:hypothetical protein n=1 Tax=Streptomyces sp. NBC_00637 TaxID=2903667 RepID=UPI002F91B0A9